MTTRQAAPWALGLLVAVLVGCATPRPPGLLGSTSGSGARSLEVQVAAITADQADAGARRVIFVGAALNGREDVFDRDIRAFDAALRPVFGPSYRSILLSNVRIEAGERELPLASIDHLDDVFDTLARHRRASDRYVVLLTTHGGPGILEVEQAARWKQPRLLSSAKLSAWVDQLGQQPSWLLISACFSGSHLAALTQDHIVAMTASAPNRPSFGCSNEEQNTWFVHELLLAMQPAASAQDSSLRGIWRRTQAGVAQREASRRLLPSQPQIRAGRTMEARLDAPLAEF